MSPPDESNILYRDQPVGGAGSIQEEVLRVLRSGAAAQLLAQQYGLVRASPGDIKPTVTVDAPVGGWLLCDYSLYDTSDYPQLSAVLFKAGWEQAPYTVGGPPTGQFYVPDFRHLALVGADPTGSSGLGALNLADYFYGATTLSIANLPAHTHPPTSNNFMLTDGTAVTLTAGAGGYRYSTGYAAATGSTGSGTPFTAMPPYNSVNFWIKT